jgi:ATP-dependent DNA helicase 2 subunit 2
MGARRVLSEEVVDREQKRPLNDTAAAQGGDGGLAQAFVVREQLEKGQEGAGSGGTQAHTRERLTTDLEWTLEFVAKKVQACILSGLKTAKIHLLLFGSPRTNARVLHADGVNEGYLGIDEIVLPDQPNISVLELIRCLRATVGKERPHPADPLDALVAAIHTQNDKQAGGVTATWRRTIYLITDGKTKMNVMDAEVIKSRLSEDGIVLKVIGVDFDDEDIGYLEEDKDPIKAQNEKWWHEFISDLPGSMVATAAKAIAQISMPSVQLQASAPYSTTLTFGDPSMQYGNNVVSIAIKMYKSTAIARPLSQKKLSKIAQDSIAARQQTAKLEASASQLRPSSTPNYPNDRKRAHEDGGEERITYGVQMQKKYFLKDDLENVEGGINSAEPLPEGAEATFDRAYKLGATLVAINDELEKKPDTKAGIEIIQFTRKDLYRRHYHMSETWFVFASDTSVKAEIEIKSLIYAMWGQGKYAIVRFVRRDGSEPKLGILAPQIRDEALGFNFDCFFFVEAPFREDLKRFTFPPLDRVVNREGKELYEHTSLPSKEMQGCMDDLVHSMDLMDAEVDLDTGHSEPWFRCEDSYNPAIHNIKEAVSWRVFHPDDTALPKPHAEVEKYLAMPNKVVERSSAIAEKCRELFDLQYVPTMAAQRKAKRSAQQGHDGGGQPSESKEIDLGGVMDEELAAEASRPPHASLDGPHAGLESSQERTSASVKEQSVTGNNIVLSKENPIDDFERKLDSPEYAVEAVISSMSLLVRTTVFSSFGSNDYSQARDMLLSLRKGAIDYEEAIQFNDFLRDFKLSLMNSGGNGDRDRSDFWSNYLAGREDLSLIRDDEALGEKTKVDKEAAIEFVNT